VLTFMLAPSQVVYQGEDKKENVNMYAPLSCALACLLLVSHPHRRWKLVHVSRLESV
jgi:hypothetical protein